MDSSSFSVEDFFPRTFLARITDLRLDEPASIRRHAQQRQRRRQLALDGKLVILAADHPARMVTGALGDDLALADRHAYLGRVLRVVTSDFVDGLMGTPDIIDEVLAVDLLLERRGGRSFLDGKLLIGCMNRGGLLGTAFEMRDYFTAFDVPGIVALNLDGAKMMLRLEANEEASGQTLYWCSQAINACLEHDLTVFVEALMVARKAGRYEVQSDVGSMARVCSVAAALGRSSLNTWLKLPYCAGYERVALSTTLPILMLGGQAVEDAQPLLENLHAGMRAGGNVRGALIGRNVLFPGGKDPRAMAAAVHAIVHRNFTPTAAQEVGESQHPEGLNLLRS